MSFQVMIYLISLDKTMLIKSGILRLFMKDSINVGVKNINTEAGERLIGVKNDW